MNELLRWIAIWSSIKTALSEVTDGGVTERLVRVTYKRQGYVIDMRIRKEAK